MRTGFPVMKTGFTGFGFPVQTIFSKPLLYTAPCPLIVTLQRYIEYLAPNVKGTLLHK